MALSLLVPTVNLPPPRPRPALPPLNISLLSLVFGCFRPQREEGPGRPMLGVLSAQIPEASPGLHPRAHLGTLLLGGVLGEPPCPSLTDMHLMWLWPCWSPVQASGIMGLSGGVHVRKARQEGTGTRTLQHLPVPTGPGFPEGLASVMCVARCLVQPTLLLGGRSLASLTTCSCLCLFRPGSYLLLWLVGVLYI